MPHFNYSDLLKRSEWKNRRSQIIKRDKVCQSCGSDKRLEVHHIFYFPNLMPWNYPGELLIVLCRDCHEKETNHSKMLDSLVKYMKYKGLLSHEIIEKLMSHILDSDFIDFHKFIEKIKSNLKR